jgi:Fe2+ or Zn2+ uptake regulation protein
MTDKDILISDLNDISEILNNNGYGGWCATIRKAVDLLKEQEAIEPEVDVLNEIDRLYRCPKCHKHFFYRKQKYCDQCGQAVKWDG